MTLWFHCQGVANSGALLRQLNTFFPGQFSCIFEEPPLKARTDSLVVRAATTTGVPVVVKIVSTSDHARAQREITLLRLFRDRRKHHPKWARHICEFRDSAARTAAPSCSALVLEIMELGTVRDFLNKRSCTFTVIDPEILGGAVRLRHEVLLNVCVDVLRGLSFLSELGVCHRDIKPANIGATFMHILGRVGFKIIGFGSAVQESQVNAPVASSPSAAVTAVPRMQLHPSTAGGMQLDNLHGAPLFMSPEHFDSNQTVREA